MEIIILVSVLSRWMQMTPLPRTTTMTAAVTAFRFGQRLRHLPRRDPLQVPSHGGTQSPRPSMPSLVDDDPKRTLLNVVVVPPRRRVASSVMLAAKKKETPGGEDYSSTSGFWRLPRKGRDDDSGVGDDVGEKSDRLGRIPFIGRFFGKNEDASERGNDDEGGVGADSAPSRLARILEARQRERDAENLREEVLRLEEERKRTIEERQRAARAARERSKAAAARVRATRSSSSAEATTPPPDDVQRRVLAQREADQRRRERVEKATSDRNRRELPSRLQAELDRDRRREAKAKAAGKSSGGGGGGQKPTPSAGSGPIRPSKAAGANTSTGKQEENRKNDSGEGDSGGARFNFMMGATQNFVGGMLDTFTPKKEEWIVVAPKTRISPGEIVPVTVAGLDLLLVASKDGAALHCIANSCPHLGTPLELATLERRPVEPPSASSSSSLGSSSSKGGGGAADVTTAAATGGSKVDGSLLVPSPTSLFMEADISRMLRQDGCEDCIVCPLHRTAFALESGEVRGEWCPYPPVIGKLTGAIKRESSLAVFDVRTRGKNIEVRLNTPFPPAGP
jgi:nitrite reductase/ring-hydroxylating ferredoxin subunit